MKTFEFDDYTFAVSTEMNGKTTTEPELEDVSEDNYMTVYVKTTSGKTFSINCNKKADAVSPKIEMRTAIP